MAQRLEAMPKKPGRQSIHPWVEWADGSVWKIKQGEDFDGALESMRTQLYGGARRLGKRIELGEIDKDEQTIIFRMFDAEE